MSSWQIPETCPTPSTHWFQLPTLTCGESQHPDFGLNAKSGDEGMLSYQATFWQWLKTGNKISSRIHSSAIIKPWKDIRTSGQISCKRSQSSMPQQYAASHQASQELEAPPANLQVVKPNGQSVNIAICRMMWDQLKHLRLMFWGTQFDRCLGKDVISFWSSSLHGHVVPFIHLFPTCFSLFPSRSLHDVAKSY